MTCIQPFCDRLDARPGDHSCELSPGHVEACRCECEACLAAVAAGRQPDAAYPPAPALLR